MQHGHYGLSRYIEYSDTLSNSHTRRENYNIIIKIWWLSHDDIEWKSAILGALKWLYIIPCFAIVDLKVLHKTCWYVSYTRSQNILWSCIQIYVAGTMYCDLVKGLVKPKIHVACCSAFLTRASPTLSYVHLHSTLAYVYCTCMSLKYETLNDQVWSTSQNPPGHCQRGGSNPISARNELMNPQVLWWWWGGRVLGH